jgi:hypothetical protein
LPAGEFPECPFSAHNRPRPEQPPLCDWRLLAYSERQRNSLHCALRVTRSIILPMEPPRLYLIWTMLFALVPQGEAPPTPTTESFEGCYELTMGRWWPWSFGEDNQFVTPPGRIRLLSERGANGFEQDGFLIRALPPLKGAAIGRGGPAFWVVKSATEIDLIWNDGFTGIRISLRRSGNALRGWAHPHFDRARLIPRIAHVNLRKTACNALP